MRWFLFHQFLLGHFALGWNFNFGTFGRDEPILVYGNGFDGESWVEIGKNLYPFELKDQF